MRLLILGSAAAFAACDHPGSAAAGAEAAVGARAAAEVAVVAGRCGSCHAMDAATAARLAPPAVAAQAPVELHTANIGAGLLPRGEKLYGELACRACHAADGIAGLAQRTDFAHAVPFLSAPAATRPDLVAHDFGLDGAEASALAAWLLRSQLDPATDNTPAPGLVVECFEQRVPDAKLPVLDGKEPKRRAMVTAIDVEPRTREDHFALRFTGYLTAPASGDYTIQGGADDCVWIWLDEQLVLENAKIAPFRTVERKVHLDAGAHALRIVFTEAEGEQQLEVKWSGPGFARQTIPAGALSHRVIALVPPPQATPAHTTLAPPDGPAGVAWAALGDGACPRSGAPAGVVAAARRALQRPREPAVELAFCMQRDGCLSCHRRDGQGGLRAEAKSALVEVEDLGDEGRLPPDLTRVGHRLRPVWLLGVLRGEHRVRPYLHVRMPHLSEAAAQRYADLFAAVDAEPGEDQEPPFSVAAVAEGRRLAGTGGFNCIACHPFGSHRAIGPQGMDLAVQFDRLRPAWFCDLLLHTTKLRPGTRMPGYWFADGEKDRAQVEALRTWLSLRRAAPVPAGFAENSAALVLDPADRPRLHGAFLEGLSARCMAVGTPEHTHYAYDLSRGRLAWLWRGAFVDADGTWSGRAGKLLQPLGDDWVVLDKDCTFAPAGGGGTQAVLAGWELAPDGLPVFHWRLDDALIDDAARPRLQAGGTVLVRELTAHGGAVRLGLPHDGRVHAFVGDEERSEVVVPAGGRAEVVYRW